MHRKHKKSAVKRKKRRMREKNIENLKKIAEGGGAVEKKNSLDGKHDSDFVDA